MELKTKNFTIMKARHTPGPWLAPQFVKDTYIWGTKDRTSVVIAEVNVQKSINPKVVISDKEALANAQLISTAPELVEMLEAILPKLSQLHDESAFTLLEKAEVLIKKAKGYNINSRSFS